MRLPVCWLFLLLLRQLPSALLPPPPQPLLALIQPQPPPGWPQPCWASLQSSLPPKPLPLPPPFHVL